MTDKALENRLRRKADRMGMRLWKSRSRSPDAWEYGLYMLTDHSTGGLVHQAGPTSGHYLTLEDVEDWLAC